MLRLIVCLLEKSNN